jgi:hypothetical protein
MDCPIPINVIPNSPIKVICRSVKTLLPCEPIACRTRQRTSGPSICRFTSASRQRRVSAPCKRRRITSSSLPTIDAPVPSTNNIVVPKENVQQQQQNSFGKWKVEIQPPISRKEFAVIVFGTNNPDGPIAVKIPMTDLHLGHRLAINSCAGTCPFTMIPELVGPDPPTSFKMQSFDDVFLRVRASIQYEGRSPLLWPVVRDGKILGQDEVATVMVFMHTFL